MVERDVINAESCYQENGEEGRRKEASEEVRPQGRRKEGHAQRGGEESLREEIRPQGRRQEGHAQRGGEESLREEGLRQARARQTHEGGSRPDPRSVRHVAPRLIGLRVPTYRLIRRGCRRFGLA